MNENTLELPLTAFESVLNPLSPQSVLKDMRELCSVVSGPFMWCVYYVYNVLVHEHQLMVTYDP